MLEKKSLLARIIRHYINSATPVASKLLAEEKGFDVCSATIRNEMARLEADGYITQPHTSAGRIPTEKGYRFYLETLGSNVQLSEANKKLIKNIIKKIENEEIELGIKNLAKKVSEMSKNTVLVGFSSDDVYYTGLANLFSQPEFNNPHCIYDLSLVIDHLDKTMDKIFEQIRKVEVKIGSENPFDSNCSVVLMPWKLKKIKGIFGILGPMRMDYEHNLGIINFVYQNIYL
jgi:transcriptional regulator of heat shock response